MQDFLLLKKQSARANKLDKYVGAICVEMFLQKFIGNPKGAGEIISRWQKCIEAGDVEQALEVATEVLSGFKGVDTIDVLLPSLASASGFLRKNAQRKFHESDFTYWREILSLRRF